ncbi:hypothetical protein HYU11_00235 [Candidatus Woesearchaeota archaeon]|nr:hypothetical protein [Candidatus Woesearchaeota archaeon]
MKKGAQKKQKVDINNPFLWILGITFLSAAGLAFIDLRNDTLTGAFFNSELNCKTQSDCVQGSCIQGYCAIDMSEPEGNWLENEITGAVAGSSPGLEPIRCQTSEECPMTSECEKNICVVKVKVVETIKTKSCSGYCGAKSEDNCYCDNRCQTYGDCCPDFREACPSLES